MWPGVLSLTSREIPHGGASKFGALAFFGDVGCSIGPWIAGFVCDGAKLNYASLAKTFPFFASLDGDQIGLKCGIFAAIVFPIVMLITLGFFKKKKQTK